MLTKVFARAVEASFHGGDAGGESLGDFRVAPALLHEGEQRAVLGAELGEGMAQRVELLGVHGTRGLGNIFVLVAKREENPAEFLAAELVDAGVAREAKEPRLELRRRLQAVEGADHLDKNLLCEILDVVAASGDGVNETRDPVLIRDDELMHRGFVAPLGPANGVGQSGR